MKQTIEVIKEATYKSRLTITPTRVTLKLAKDVEGNFADKIVRFAEYVVEQFIGGFEDDWRGEIRTELVGLQLFSIVLRSGIKTRKYEGILV